MKWLWLLLNRVGQFVRRDRSRFTWEIIIAVVVWFVGYGLNWIFSQQTLQNCQDERTELLRQIRHAQGIQDSIRYAGQLAEKDQLIHKQNEQILDLHERIARDSIYQRSLLQSIERINNYVERGSASAKPYRLN